MKKVVLYSILGIGIVFLFLIDILLGSVSIPMSEYWAWVNGQETSEAFEFIVFKSRLPKAITAVLCGASLALSGLLMQTLFRNPLAGPYLLGISSGAGLGVAILVMGAGLLGFGVISGFSLNVAAILGALLILLILFIVSLRLKDVMTLLIFGVMMGSIATAIIGLIQFFTSDFQLKSFVIWTLGSLSSASFSELLALALFLFLSTMIVLRNYKGLNAILIGEDFAKLLGIKIMSVRLLSILITGVLAGLTTAFCGPIGFVGIIIPHLSRLILKSNDHLYLIPACLLLGALVMLLSDVLAHLPIDGTSLPINSITALIGIPIILWILFGKKKLSQTF